MKPIDKRLFWKYVLLNLGLASLLVFLMDYLVLFRKGLLSYIGFILNAPSYLILFIIIGPTNTLHFISDRTFLIVSFIFYSVLIALIQVFVYRRKRKRRNAKP